MTKIFQVWSVKASYPNQGRARSIQDFENGISSRQFKTVNLILVRKITNEQFFFKWNKSVGGQSLIRNYVPAQFLMAIAKML